jgi:hypothetical protein
VDGGSSNAICIYHEHNLFRLATGEAANIGRVRTARAIIAAVITPDGKSLLYYGNELRIKALGN